MGMFPAFVITGSQQPGRALQSPCQCLSSLWQVSFPFSFSISISAFSFLSFATLDFHHLFLLLSSNQNNIKCLNKHNITRIPEPRTKKRLIHCNETLKLILKCLKKRRLNQGVVPFRGKLVYPDRCNDMTRASNAFNQ